MKKIVCMLIAVVMILTLAGCSKSTTEAITLEATVVSCENGTFHQNSTYSSQATMALANGNYTNYALYSSLANATGYYDYKITVSIGDDFQTVVRNNKYEVGSIIYVEKVITYNESNELIKTVYR